MNPIRRWPSSTRCSVASRAACSSSMVIRIPGPGSIEPIRAKGMCCFVQQAGDQRIVGVRRSQDHAVGLKRGDGRAKLALDMVVMRVDQLDHHAIAELGAFQHAAEQHLVDPVDALPRRPVGNGAVAVVERQDQVGSRSAHPLRGDRRNIAQLVDRRLHPRLHLRRDVGAVVDHAADRLQRHPCIGGDMLDRDRLAAAAAWPGAGVIVGHGRYAASAFAAPQ